MIRLASFLVATSLVACAAEPDPDLDADDGADTDSDDTLDEDVAIALTDDAAALAPTVTRRVYGSSVQGRALAYYEVRPSAPNGKRAFLTFAIHGFEDAWKQDGRALSTIAHAAISHYGKHPEKLAGWTLYIVPSANPDGMRAGVNNWREQDGAFGRCTAHGKDMNRNVSAGTSREQRELKALFDEVAPTIAIDFHGWYNTYYGNTRIGGFFQRAFNAAYEGKPATYCFVDSAAAMDCGPTRGGIFHGSSSISRDLFAEWATRERGVPSALVEYPAPDFNGNGAFDTVWDAELGYRRMGNITLGKMWSRTRVALDYLFVEY